MASICLGLNELMNTNQSMTLMTPFISFANPDLNPDRIQNLEVTYQS